MTTTSIAQSKPNVLVILVDDLGWGDLGCFGADDLKTPHIDSLAASGIKFNNFFANSSVCSPSRASLLTGRYPGFVGVPGVIRTFDRSNYGYFDPQAVTLADMFKKSGYHSSIIGKWHLGLESPNKPNERGFDFFHGFLGDMMDDYYTHLRHDRNYMRRNIESIDPRGHATDLFSNWASDYLKERARGQEPFFLYLAYNAPHTPIQPPEEWYQRVLARKPGIDEKRARMVALIEHLDHGIGQVLNTLQETGLSKDTIVIFNSDNGGELGAGANVGPWRSGKAHMYDGGLRVPMCASWPGVIKPETVTEVRALTMDIYPTVLDAAGISVDHEIDGRSLAAVFEDNKLELPPREEYFVFLQQGIREAAYSDGFKLVRDQPEMSRYELFNVAKDPSEKNDIAAENDEKLFDLTAGMQRHLHRLWSTQWRRPSQLETGEEVMGQYGIPNPEAPDA